MAIEATYFRDELGWSFECSESEGVNRCGGRRVVDDRDGVPQFVGDDEDGRVAGFISRGWPTKQAAQERFAQHRAEHDTAEPAPEPRELLLKITEGGR